MSSPGIDVLAIGAHPDDVELGVGGTLLLARELGRRAAICHLTAGELGTRGSPEQRAAEARDAATLLGVASMEILDLPDGRIEVDLESKRRVVELIRRHRPALVLAPWVEDLHPDHAAAGRLVRECAFLSGLRRWDERTAPWRPDAVLYYMSHTQVSPEIVVDISEVFDRKEAAARCYRSQFHDPDSKEPATYISGENFWHWWRARAAHWGHPVGARYAEGFLFDGPLPTRDPFSLFESFGKYPRS